jgi:hypothetical protein
MEKKMADAQPITVTAMILCDGVARDDLAGKTTIVGCSTGFRVEEMPTVLPPFAVYLMFSDVTRKVRLDFRIVTQSDDVIYELPPAIANTTDPLLPMESDPRFTNVKVEEVGDYFIRLLADGVFIMDLRFKVALGQFGE